MEERLVRPDFYLPAGYAGAGSRQSDCNTRARRHRKGRQDREDGEVGPEAHGLPSAASARRILCVHGRAFYHGEVVKELERRLKVADAVMKYLTVRVDEELKRQDKLKRHREKRAARRPRKTAAAPAPADARQRRTGRGHNLVSNSGEIEWQKKTHRIRKHHRPRQLRAGTNSGPSGPSGHSGPPGHGGPSRFGGPGGPRPQGGGRPGGPGEARQAQFHPEEESVPVLRGQVGLH